MQSASAVPTFYYDPDTGNVSFDTLTARHGGIYSFQFNINERATSIRFRTENQVRVSRSTLVTSRPDAVGDVSLSGRIEGLLTIGDVLPAGLSEETWSVFFADFSTAGAIFRPEDGLGRHIYTDEIGTGQFPPPATFVYGRPDREFDNRWHDVDPDSLTWAEAATLIYQPANGRLWLDTSGNNGGYISGFVLQSDGQFTQGAFDPFVDTSFFQSTSDTVGLFADAVEPGRYNLGRLLPSRLSTAELEAAFTHATFVGRAGFGGDIDLAPRMPLQVSVAAVPEPTTLLLAITAGVGLIRRRRL